MPWPSSTTSARKTPRLILGGFRLTLPLSYAPEFPVGHRFPCSTPLHVIVAVTPGHTGGHYVLPILTGSRTSPHCTGQLRILPLTSSPCATHTRIALTHALDTLARCQSAPHPITRAFRCAMARASRHGTCLLLRHEQAQPVERHLALQEAGRNEERGHVAGKRSQPWDSISPNP